MRKNVRIKAWEEFKELAIKNKPCARALTGRYISKKPDILF